MKLPALAIALSLAAFPALAQNAAQVSHAQAGANCPRCNLFQADLSNKTLRARNYAGARLRQADLSLSVFNHGDFAGADLRDVNGYGALFSSANFTRANLTNSTFVGAYLQGASFRGATLIAALQVARGKAAQPRASGPWFVKRLKSGRCF
jgi:uncharacterized protein YjbI with pentapeptide repeats